MFLLQYLSHEDRVLCALAKSSGNFSGVSVSQFDYDKDEEEEGADESEVATGQSEPQQKKVKLWLGQYLLRSTNQNLIYDLIVR